MSKHIDETGITYGFLTAISRAPSVGGATRWLFRCRCGVEKTIRLGNVKIGAVKSCGCHRRQIGVALAAKHPIVNFIDITGMRFSRLTAISYVGGSKWHFSCECGGSTTTKAGKVKSGHTKSCGCLNSEVTAKRNTTHGLSYSLAYNSWRGMKERCDNPKHSHYARYGGRGIGYDQSWQSFEAFFADMGECPADHSLDRIDGSAGYSAQNCRWATEETQQNNTRQNVRITLNGESLTAAQWARKLEIPVQRIYSRIRNGWSHERALSPMNPLR
jgi:hypothetical protein